MNILEARQVKMMEKEVRVTRKTNELTKQKRIDDHKISSYLEDVRMVKSYGLTMEDIL